MNTITILRSLGPVDARNMLRDGMMRWLVVLTPGMALLFRYVVPVMTQWIDEKLGFDLVPYYALIMSFVGMIAAAMVGSVIGFLLLDQRDDQTLPALLVTPLSLEDYLRYRLVVPMVVSAALAMIMFPLAGLTTLSVGQVVAASLCAAPIAPLYALFIGSFAANKVQGFALAKAVGVLVIPVIVSYFVAPPWQFAFGIVPHFWPLKVFWLFDAGAPGWGWACAAVGLAYQVLVLRLLARRFAHVVLR